MAIVDLEFARCPARYNCLNLEIERRNTNVSKRMVAIYDASYTNNDTLLLVSGTIRHDEESSLGRIRRCFSTALQVQDKCSKKIVLVLDKFPDEKVNSLTIKVLVCIITRHDRPVLTKAKGTVTYKTQRRFSNIAYKRVIKKDSIRHWATMPMLPGILTNREQLIFWIHGENDSIIEGKLFIAVR